MALQIHSFEAGPVATIGYVLVDDERHDAVIIDAPLDSAERMAQTLERADARPGALILTHTHWDHTGDAAELKRRYPSMLVYVHPDDEYRLAEPMKHTVWQLPFTIEGLHPDRYLRDGDELVLGNIHLAVIHTPGHTEGGICLYDEANGTIFVGDTLFAGSVGRTDLPGGDWATLLSSITNRLLPLPDDVTVLPGHGDPTSIGAERIANPFVGGA